jgi:hypothetical protein
MSKFEVADVRFKVCEFGDGTPYLCPLEGGPKNNKVFNADNLFAIHLKDGTTMQEAEALAAHLNKFATKLGITFLP